MVVLNEGWIDKILSVVKIQHIRVYLFRWGETVPLNSLTLRSCILNTEEFFANGEHLITNAEARVRDKEHRLNYLKDYVASLEINEAIADSREEIDSES